MSRYAGMAQELQWSHPEQVRPRERSYFHAELKGDRVRMPVKNKNANNTNQTNDANGEKALCEDLSYQILNCAFYVHNSYS